MCLCSFKTAQQREPLASQPTAQDNKQAAQTEPYLLLLNLKYFQIINKGHFHHFFNSGIGILSKPDSFCKQVCFWRCNWQTYFFRSNIIPENTSGKYHETHNATLNLSSFFMRLLFMSSLMKKQQIAIVPYLNRTVPQSAAIPP